MTAPTVVHVIDDDEALRDSIQMFLANEGLEVRTYASADEFLGDLTILRDSLAANRGLRIARSLVDPLILLVRTFGLHLHTLDIRQHARLHAVALKEAVADNLAPELPKAFSDDTRSVLETFNME